MHRFRLDQGWTTFWLVVLLVFTATWSVQQADWADGLHILTPITILGLIVGLVLTQARQLPAAVAHTIAFVLGVLVVLFQMTSFLSDALGTRREKLSWLWDRWTTWFSAIRAGEPQEDLYLFILMVSALLWILSYVSVWFIFRSGWIWATMLLPGVVVLLNLGYSRHVSTFVLILYLFVAILLLMRFNFVQRESEWTRKGVPFPESLLVRGLWTASYLAIILILAGWFIPFSPQSERALAAWDSVSTPWTSMERTFNDLFGGVLRGGSGGSGVGGFASFGSEFQLGGTLRLSEEPVVLVDGARAPYLSAHSYDYFNGIGWESTVEQTYVDASGNATSLPLLSFDTDQSIPIPDYSRQRTVESTIQVEVYRPQGSIVLSGGETLRADLPMRVQAAWYSYDDQELPIDGRTEGDTPPDLWPLVDLLQGANFAPDDDVEADVPWAPFPDAPVDGESEVEIDPEMLSDDARRVYERAQSERAALADRGIDTSVVLNEAYEVEAIRFSGLLPVFNDVEAVFASEIRSGDVYAVTSLVSEARTDELRSAPSMYPSEITRRYLQVPENVSPRVEDLALELVADHDNPFDKATAIERYLRANFTYSEEVTLPPDGVDFVEYFLFESQEGYCTYYATSMAQMLRIAEIPSRVVVGYFPADYDEDAGGYLYRDRNAHAWVEVYFSGYGWIPFEPTPSRSVFQRGSIGGGDDGGASMLDEQGLGGLFPEDRLGFFEEEEFPPMEGGEGGFLLGQDDSTTPGQWAMRIVALLLLAGAGILGYYWLRGLRGLSPAGQFFTRLQRGATWSGVAATESMTPYEYARTIASRVPGSRTDAEFLAGLYVRERFGRARLTAPELTRARAAWLRLRGLFLRFMIVRRWRARRTDHGSGD
jgi:transglutaminase-like putative cysteine protease